MKLSLRNLALGATLCVAGAAMAQDAPFTVEKNWYKLYDAGTYTNAEYRYGTGFGGKVYATNKTTSKLSVITNEGITDIDAKGAVSVNATHDDAGNILFKRSWAAADTDVKNWAIYNAETGEITELDLTEVVPSDITPGRMDVTGRAIGNVLSEDGGLVLFACNGAPAPYCVRIANGQAVALGFSDYPVPEAQYPCDSSTIAQFNYTFEDVVGMGDDWAKSVVVRKRGNKAPSYISEETGEWTKYLTGENATTMDGFDVFTLGDKVYTVVPSTTNAEVAYTSQFAIIDVETGATVFQSDNEEASTASGQGFGTITANKVDDYTVEIYIVGMGNAKRLYAGQWTVTAPKPFEAPQVFLRGDINDWAGEFSYMFTPQFDLEAPTTNANGEYEYRLYLDYLYGDFKLGGMDWATFDYGAKGEDPNITADCTKESWAGSSEHFKLNGKQYTEVTLNFYYNPDPTKPSYLKFVGTEYIPAPTAERAHFAYDLNVEKGEGANYTVKFKSTGDALKAVLVLTEADNAEAEPITAELGEVKAGENSFPYSAADLTADKKYNWAIELHNYEIPETKVIKSAPTTGAKYSGTVVTMLDDQYPSFGYTVVGEQVRNGFDVYAPDGTLVKSGVYKDHALLGGANSTNGSNPIRGAEHMGHALVGAWGDDAHGLTAFDPTNLDADLYSVFEGEKESNGAIKKDGVGIGSGTSGVGVSGKGEDAILVTFDEDILGNHLAMYPIGTKRTIDFAPVDWDYKSTLANTNVEMVGTSKGFFIAQCRSEGNSRGGVPGAAFVTREGDMNWTCAEFVDETLLTSSNAAVAVNKDETLVAFSSYSNIYVMSLSWEGDKPVIDETPLYVIPFTVEGSSNWATMRFDAANNLHVYFKSATVGAAGSGYQLYVLADKEPIATTNALATSTIANETGVENIAVEANEGEAVYYNLNGVRVAADTLTPGVYVKVVGKTATKVVVK